MSQHAEACTARSIKPFQLAGFTRPIFQPVLQDIGYLGLHRKKYHPVKDFDKEGWKKRQLFTEYYTANLHIGAFMLPKYVEDIFRRRGRKKMSCLLVIGCGGVAQVAISKICQDSETFTEIMIASRTKSKCDDLKAKLEGKTNTKIETAALDADKVEEVIALIESYKPEAVLNVALPYQDLTIMDACLATGVHYIDTANYEAEDTEDPEWRAIYEKRCKELGFTAYFDYSWQWAYQEKFKEAGLTALLGSGFDPGVTSVFSAYALKHYFDEIHYIDILDCNGVTTVIHLRQTLTQKSISARFLHQVLTGKMENGLKSKLCLSSVSMISLRLDKKTCISFTTKKSNHWLRTFQVSNVFVSL